MTNAIDFTLSVSLAEATTLILNNPNVRFLLEGEPGIGKSSLMVPLSEALPNHHMVYVDMSETQLGDVGIPVPNHETKTVRLYPTERFGLHTGKPVCIMLDEFSKAPRAVQNLMHPLLEAHNPRLGDLPLPEGSYVFLTGNLSTDGVGDNLAAHTLNRVTRLRVRKPDHEEWLEWAVPNDIDPAVCAFAKRTPHLFQSYLEDDAQDNPYIFNPLKNQIAPVVTPRSLAKVSNIVGNREHYTPNALRAALAGTIGEAAGRDLAAFIAYQDQLPSIADIVADPTGVPVPRDPGASAVLIYSMPRVVSKKNADAFVTYLSRFEEEWQALAFRALLKNPEGQGALVGNAAFRDWMLNNQDIIG